MHPAEFILYVASQERARAFYAAVLGTAPSLDVPGMTEFDLDGATLGLMPLDDIVALVPGLEPGAGQRCELYLRRRDAAACLERLGAAGGSLLAPLAERPWGERVGYGLDPDGHVVAFAELEGEPDR